MDTPFADLTVHITEAFKESLPGSDAWKTGAFCALCGFVYCVCVWIRVLCVVHVVFIGCAVLNSRDVCRQVCAHYHHHALTSHSHTDNARALVVAGRGTVVDSFEGADYVLTCRCALVCVICCVCCP